MYGLLVAFGAWFNNQYALAVFAVSFATITGWPFCIVATIPLALDCIKNRGIVKVIMYGVASLVCFLVCDIGFASYYIL
jgi:hypothetical protein